MATPGRPSSPRWLEEGSNPAPERPTRQRPRWSSGPPEGPGVAVSASDARPCPGARRLHTHPARAWQRGLSGGRSGVVGDHAADDLARAIAPTESAGCGLAIVTASPFAAQGDERFP